MTLVADALFFLARLALALVLACGLIALGVYAGATAARAWLRRRPPASGAMT